MLSSITRQKITKYENIFILSIYHYRKKHFARLHCPILRVDKQIVELLSGESNNMFFLLRNGACRFPILLVADKAINAIRYLGSEQPDCPQALGHY
jgi:hypothetical protein